MYRYYDGEDIEKPSNERVCTYLKNAPDTQMANVYDIKYLIQRAYPHRVVGDALLRIDSPLIARLFEVAIEKHLIELPASIDAGKRKIEKPI